MQAAPRIETRGWPWGFALRAARRYSPEASSLERKLAMGAKTDQAKDGISLWLVDQNEIWENVTDAITLPVRFELMISEPRRGLAI
jgi:hypothetical protein